MHQYRKTPRASFLDYNVGEFFITICTGDKKHYFGEIHNGIMYLSVIGEFKYARSVGLEFSWQERYHDHFIRKHDERYRISEYIANNIARWGDDQFNQ